MAAAKRSRRTTRPAAKGVAAKKRAAKQVPAHGLAKKRAAEQASAGSLAPLVATGSPEKYRARVRMYRQGLGDCFLLTFPRKTKSPLQMLIDCGALARDAAFMTRIVEHIRDCVRDGGAAAKPRLDVVVGTHEHKDHLSGFNQARKVFDSIDIGAVWLAWTENLTEKEVRTIKETKKKALKSLETMLASPLAAAAGETVAGIQELLGFSSDDPVGNFKVADAVEYLKKRGKAAGDLRYLEPGAVPFELDDVEDVKVYVLGPPHDPVFLKTSKVTEAMKRDDVIYHLSLNGQDGIEALAAAIPNGSTDAERYYPFGSEHRITKKVADPLNPKLLGDNPYYAGISDFVGATYDNEKQAWRRIDQDWMSAFGQLALDLDSDTNNTSLVLAFEFQKTKEVLLFVADAQVGNWQSWGKITFKVPGREPIPALDLLRRTVFYKVGHHCSHNATLKSNGLQLMNREDLVAFIPLDKETAGKQGVKGWEMPAPKLFDALRAKTGNRVVISDVKETLSPEAAQANVLESNTYVDYFLK